MENKANETSAESSITSNNGSKKLTLPIIALIFDILPIISVFGFSNIFLFTMLSPIVGLIVGVAALCQGKDVIGRAGATIAIIAIALPVACIGIIILFFVGATTGIISFM